MTRFDLPVGLAFAQVLHAAGESSPGNLNPGTYAIALGVPDEPALERLAKNLESLSASRGSSAPKVQVHRIVESHGPYRGQLMAIGIAPGPKSVAGRYMTHIPLLRARDFQEARAWLRTLDLGLQQQEKLQKENQQLKRELQEEQKLTWFQRIKRRWRRHAVAA